MLKMVDALEKSLERGHPAVLPWMTDDTKKQAKLKLQAIRNKIGYPDVWRDYSSVAIKPDDLLGNVERANEFESKRQIAKIGKPLDRNEWGMTPPDGQCLLQRLATTRSSFRRESCSRPSSTRTWMTP